MYFYDNIYFKDITEITSKYNLVSASKIMKICNCNQNGFNELIEKRKIKPHVITLEPSKKIYTLYKSSDFEELEVFKKSRMKDDTIPQDYKTKIEFCEILGLEPKTLNNIVYWCKDFNKYSKYFYTKNVKKLYYLVTPETLKFYQEKLQKYFNPNREQNKLKLEAINQNITNSLFQFEQRNARNYKHHKIKIDKKTLSYMLNTNSTYYKTLVDIYKYYSSQTVVDVSIMELHHIVPRFYARNGAYYPEINNMENLIYLPPNIHFLVHFLEYKCSLPSFKEKFFGACCIKVSTLDCENIQEKYITEITNLFIKAFFHK